jgi:diguanylate cyclase (GGDEF)-like protein
VVRNAGWARDARSEGTHGEESGTRVGHSRPAIKRPSWVTDEPLARTGFGPKKTWNEAELHIWSKLVAAGEDGFPGTTFAAVIGIIVIAAVLGYLTGAFQARSRLRRWHEEQERAERRHDQQTRRLQSEISDLQDEITEIQNLLRCIPDLAQRLTATKDVDSTCEQILSTIQTMLPARQVCILITQEKGYIPWVGVGIDQEILRREVIPFGQGRLGWIGERGLITYASQLTKETGLVRNQVFGAGEIIEADIYVPLVHGRSSLGMITLKQLDRRPRFERQILGALKDLFSTALAGNRAFEEISQRANRDGLTGLYNMTFFKQHFEIEISKARRNGGFLAIFMFDIDHFKHYNDTQGHLAGDEVLRRVGRLFREHMRAVDICARYGGEEFIVLTPGLNRDDALHFAERFRNLFLAHPFPHKESQPNGTLSFSGGIAAYPMDGLSVNELIRTADAALYVAKRHDRNQIVQASGPIIA